MNTKTKPFESFEDFYPYYLGEHANLVCRKLHFIGTSFVIILLLTIFATANWWLFAFVPVLGYGFAWAGHFIYEKNRPATFKHPFYSLMGDFQMFWEILTGKIKAF